MLSRNIKLAFSAATLPIVLIACDSDEFDSQEPPASDLAAELGSQPSYEFEIDASQITASAAALRIDEVREVDFEVLSGDVVVASEGELLSLVDLHVELGDVVVSPDVLPPRGLELTDISVDLLSVASGSAEWSGDNQVSATVTASFVLHWAAVRDDRAVPLADITIDGVPMAITVKRDGSTSVSMTAAKGGPFWTWAETFELRDLDLALAAR